MIFNNQENNKKLGLSMFYFLINYNPEDQLHSQYLFEAMKKITEFIHFEEKTFFDIAFDESLRIVRQ